MYTIQTLTVLLAYAALVTLGFIARVDYRKIKPLSP